MTEQERIRDDQRRTLPADAVRVCARLRQAGHPAWLVGGGVRDLLLGKQAVDWDIATAALPEQVTGLFRRVIPTGIEHGTVTVLQNGRGYEVTTLRGETTYSDGRHPDSVVFTAEIRDDLARRDFTVNAMAIDPTDGVLVDPYGGRADLEARLLRAVGDPAVRFAEDGLRPLRAARFCATLSFDIEHDTLAAIEPALSTYRRVSAERIRDEWVKALGAAQPSRAFEVMRKTGLLAVTAPALLEMVGCAQNAHHAYDVWHHTMACLDACPPHPVVRMAALLHDIGKPRTRAPVARAADPQPAADPGSQQGACPGDARGEVGQSDSTFYGHEIVGAAMARQLAECLRFSNHERDRIAALVNHHLILYSDDWSDAAVRRFIHRVTPALIEDLFVLARADVIAKGTPDAEAHLAGLDRLAARVKAIVEAKHALTMRDLVVDGNDVMRELGIGPSRRVRDVLSALFEKVMEQPALNERATLLAMIREMG